MPPFYPEQFPNQYPDQQSYADPYNQYQYAVSPQQPTPPYSRVQVNVPPRQQQQQQPQPHNSPGPPPQPQYNYSQNFHPGYGPSTPQFNYQYQPQPQPQPSPQQLYPPSYQQLSPTRSLMQQPQQYYQPMPQYQAPPPQIQVNVPRPQPPQPQYQPQPQRVLKDVQSITPRQQQQQHVPPKPPQSKSTPESPELKYDILLLSLADEYLEAAHKLPVRSEDYFKLTATALGCIEAVLNNFKLSPLREAQVTLRYAQLLFNETENYDDAERMLAKTIDLCERLKYHDLKYGAQLLLTRVLYLSRPKAALKDLQGMIQDIEAYKHTAWEYAFRLQYVMFLVSSGMSNDSHVAISQLERICHVARQSGDHAILAFAAAMEALIHLQTVGPESVLSSQRSLAKARALQLNPDVEANPQLCLIMEFVDLCIQIKSSDMAQSEQKRKAMQSVLYPALQKSAWRNDGLMYLPINQTSLRGLQAQDSGLITDRNGKYFLAFSWLLKDEVEDLGYLLSGISAAQKNAGEGGKAEKFLDEGLSMIKEILDEKKPINNAGDFMKARQQLVRCHFLLELAFLQSSKGQWAKAQATIKEVEVVARKLGNQFPAEMRCMTEYAKGAICQGRGELEEALAIFQSPVLNIISQLDNHGAAKPVGQHHKRDDAIRNLCILGAMNTIFIVKSPSHTHYHILAGLVNAVDPLASHHSNRNIQAAWNFVLASLTTNTILKTKQYLGNALNIAQTINNAQITTLCLVTMQEKFFKGVVGEQAVKCAKAASHQAKRLNEPLWIAAASGLEADCMNLHGRMEESWQKSTETERALRMVPEKVKETAAVP